MYSSPAARLGEDVRAFALEIKAFARATWEPSRLAFPACLCVWLLQGLGFWVISSRLNTHVDAGIKKWKVFR